VSIPRRTAPSHPALVQHAEDRAQNVQNRIADTITRFAGSMIGIPKPWRANALRSDGRWVQLGDSRANAAQPLSQGEGAPGFGAVGEEAAGLPAHPPAPAQAHPTGGRHRWFD
jgi:hypothetical protein